jgi:short-subunit dehydrogenase
MRTALVTGASRGLGAAFAARLARDGHDLVLVARDRNGLENVATSARAQGVAVEIITADLTDTRDLAALQQRLVDQGRPVDLLVNNAGVKSEGDFVSVDRAGLQGEIDTNITAVMRLTRAVLPGMIERGRGDVINVASFAGYLAGRGDAYSATKSWVLAFSDTVAASLAGSGVRMMALCPAQIGAGMNPRSATVSGSGLSPEVVVDTCLADLARGRTLSVPGRRYRAVVDFLELPRRTLRILARLAGRRSEQYGDAADLSRCSPC